MKGQMGIYIEREKEKSNKKTRLVIPNLFTRLKVSEEPKKIFIILVKHFKQKHYLKFLQKWYLHCSMQPLYGFPRTF